MTTLPPSIFSAPVFEIALADSAHACMSQGVCLAFQVTLIVIVVIGLATTSMNYSVNTTSDQNLVQQGWNALSTLVSYVQIVSGSISITWSCMMSSHLEHDACVRSCIVCVSLSADFSLYSAASRSLVRCLTCWSFLRTL